MNKNFIMWLLVTSQLSGGEKYNSPEIIRRSICMRVDNEEFEVQYSRTGNPNTAERENFIALKKKSSVIFKMTPLATEDIYWDGNFRELGIGEKNVILLIAKDSWDGDDPRHRDVLIFFDNVAAVSIKPEMGNEMDYSYEIKNVLSKFDDKLSNDDINKLLSEIKIFRSN